MQMETDQNQPFNFGENTQHRDLIHQVAFDHHGRRLATCSSDMMVTIWDRATDGKWTKSASWKVHGGVVWRVVWAHPEFGHVIATCSYDRAVHIWEEIRDTHNGEKRCRWAKKAYLADSRENVTDVKFAPRHLGLQIATCSTQGIVRVYEAEDIMELSRWSLLHELQSFYTRCGALSWSTSRCHRPLLAVASDEPRSKPDERLVIYEYHDNCRKWIRVHSIRISLNSPVLDVRFSPFSTADTHKLAIAAGDVFIYDIKTPASAFVRGEDEEEVETGDPTEYSTQRVAVLGDLHKAWRLSWNVTGNVLTATSGDGTVRVWKSMFMSKWVQLSCMSAEDYAPDAPPIVRPMLTAAPASAHHTGVYY